MEIVKAKYDVIGECATNIDDTLTEIELAGRVSYQSQDKITKDSAIKFCEMIAKRGHHSVLEHSNIVISQEGNLKPLEAFPGITQLPFHIIKQTLNKRYIGGNIRAWIDYLTNFEKAKPVEVIKLISNYLKPIIKIPAVSPTVVDPTYQLVTNHEEIPKEMKRVMVRFICPRGVSHELVRHRVRIGITQESTRWVRYNNIQVCQPPGLSKHQQKLWCKLIDDSEVAYCGLLSQQCEPQIARSVLPIALKTEIVVTADLEEWNWIFHMRCAPDVQPEMRALMIPLEKEFKDIGWM